MKNLKNGSKSFMLIGLFIFLMNICGIQCFAQLKTAAIFGSNAVFQQNQKVPVWGTAKPKEKVEVIFGSFITHTITDEVGKWKVLLPTMKADGKTYQLTIKGETEKIVYDNIVFGEVWLASGQSNMAYTMSGDLMNKEEELKNATYPNIRFRNLEGVTAIVPSEIIPQKDWKICTPQTIGECSAVAYFFARSLHLDQHIPVGIIVAARGSTGIDTWMSKDCLIKHPDYTKALQTRDENPAHWDSIVNDGANASNFRDSIGKNSFIGLTMGVHKIDFDDASWKKSGYPVSGESMGTNGFWGVIWMRKTFDISQSQLTKKWTINLPLKDQDDIVYVNGKEVAKGVSRQKNKTVAIPNNLLLEGKNVITIRFCVNYNIAEIGNKETDCFMESTDKEKINLEGTWAFKTDIEPKVSGWIGFHNTSTVNFNAMIYPLIPYAIKGFLWYQGENNIWKGAQYVELSTMMIKDWRERWQEGNIPFLYVQLPFNSARGTKPVDGDKFSTFREYQRNILQKSPNTGMACTIDIGDVYNIHPSNKQDVGKRLYLIAQDLAYHQNVISSGPVFKEAKVNGNEVRVSFQYAEDGFKVKGANLENCFAISDTAGKWYWAEARIDRKELVLHSKEVDKPTKVQYGWQNNPYTPLYNQVDLPMQPFNVKL